MNRAETLAHNAGVGALADVAAASAKVLRARLTEAPTRYSFAVAALDGIVEAAVELMLPVPGDDTDPPVGAVAPRSPGPIADGAVAVEGAA